jgi:hypothetical protein
VKISFDSNKGSASSALDYAENGMDSKKVLRAEPPEWLGGMPLQLFRGTGRDVVAMGTNGLATFSLGYEECPPLDVRHRVFNMVVAFLGAGVEPWDLAHTGVAHWKAEPATGRLSADDHGYVFKLILSRAIGFQPYYYERDQGDFEILQEHINYSFGFTSPLDPEKFRVAYPAPEKRDTAEIRTLKREIGDHLAEGVATGAAVDRDSVVAWLRMLPRIGEVHLNTKSISVQLGAGPKMRLRALAFESRFRAADIPAIRAARARKDHNYYQKELPKRLQARADRQSREAYGKGYASTLFSRPLTIDEILDMFRSRKSVKKTDEPKKVTEAIEESPIFWPKRNWPIVDERKEHRWAARAPDVARKAPGPTADEITVAIRKLQQGLPLRANESSWFVEIDAGYRLSRVAAEGLWSSSKVARDEAEKALVMLNGSIRAKQVPALPIELSGSDALPDPSKTVAEPFCGASENNAEIPAEIVLVPVPEEPSPDQEKSERDAASKCLGIKWSLKCDPEELIKRLGEANALVAIGKDLSSMSEEALGAVEIMPATRVKRKLVRDGNGDRWAPDLDDQGDEILEIHPYAGRVGLSDPSIEEVTTDIAHAKGIIGDLKSSKGEVKEATARLSSLNEVVSALEASLGLGLEQHDPEMTVRHGIRGEAMDMR